jgi:hypothetical protein
LWARARFGSRERREVGVYESREAGAVACNARL